MAKRKLPGQKVKSIRLPPTSPNEAQICKDEYPYQPLVDPKRHIRVLVLEPGRGSSVIIGHFLTRRLTIGKVQGNVKVEPAYEALSYSWGNAKETSTIRLAVGKTSGDRRRTLLYQVTVTKTLESCLKRLRNKSEARYLWVDSLCINQMDHDEKSVQVEAMGSIYRQAEQVCVWLGRTENGSKEAFDLIRQIIQIDGIGNAIENRDNTRRWRAFGALLRRKCKLLMAHTEAALTMSRVLAPMDCSGDRFGALRNCSLRCRFYELGRLLQGSSTLRVSQRRDPSTLDEPREASTERNC